MKKTLCTAIAIQLLATAAAFAECNRDAAPAIPDGSSASKEVLLQTQGELKSYMKTTNAYLSCLDKSARKSDTKSKRIARNQAYAQAVDEMNAVADQFNMALRTYKKQNA